MAYPLPLLDCIEHCFINCAGFLALLQEGDTWTYGQVSEWRQQLTHQLDKKLGRQQHTVGLCLWNQAEWVVSLLALWQCGQVVVPLNPTLSAEELITVARDAQLSVIITDDRLVPDDFPVARWCNRQLQWPTFILAPSPNLQAAPEDLALLIYTSGTTGKPKGVMLTHANVYADVSANIQVIQATANDRFISLSPFFHVFGLINVLLTSLVAGAQLTLIRRFHPGRIITALQQEHVSVLTGVPTMYQQLLRYLPDDTTGFSRLRVCHSGAAPMPEPLFHQIEARLHVPVQEGYGLSEASSIVTSNPLTCIRKPGYIGLPVPGVTVSLRNEKGQPILPGSPETGELWVQGTTVMPGYWRQPDTACLINDLDTDNQTVWLKTGDRMTHDLDGYLRFAGRTDDLLNIDGFKCYPVEIETILLGHPEVFEVAVSLNVQGKLQAFVVPATEADCLTLANRLRRYALEWLTPYKVPAQWRWVEALPKGATGKLLRKQLN